ncbi:MAG: tetratricopeptide repeat protein [Marinilabiliaceae bacterium]|nr:tetratricopeptide repeat protein [Marinilabiliaceae bacterium]
MNKLLTIFILTIHLSAWANDQRFSAANEQYSKNEFEQAATAYEDILKTGVESEALYFNLGNAYYKQGQLPQAILNYERALLLDPDDKDILYNLELANSQTADRIVPLGEFFLTAWIKGIINKGTSDFWAWTAIWAFLICVIFAAVYVYMTNPGVKKGAFYTSMIMLLVVILSVTFASTQKQQLTERKYGIVFTPSVTVKSSPDISGTDIFVIHEGVKVKILEKLGSWNKVQLKDGSEGWLQESAVVII